MNLIKLKPRTNSLNICRNKQTPTRFSKRPNFSFKAHPPFSNTPQYLTDAAPQSHWDQASGNPECSSPPRQTLMAHQTSKAPPPHHPGRYYPLSSPNHLSKRGFRTETTFPMWVLSTLCAAHSPRRDSELVSSNGTCRCAWICRCWFPKRPSWVSRCWWRASLMTRWRSIRGSCGGGNSTGPDSGRVLRGMGFRLCFWDCCRWIWRASRKLPSFRPRPVVASLQDFGICYCEAVYRLGL